MIDFNYLRPPQSEVQQIKHDPFYIKHGEGKHHVRKIFFLQEFDEYENQKIQELQDSIHKHSLQLPADWNRELTLKYCYSGGFEISKCVQRLQKHLEWMQDPNYQVLNQEAEHYLKSGYLYQFGRDKELRPVVYIQLHMISKMKLHVPTLLNAATAVGNVVTRYMYVKGYVENWIVILDSGGSGLFDFPFSTLSMINEFFSINFTSSLHKMFILNPSFIFNSSWKLIEKIIHPETAAKINFLKQTDFYKLQEVIPAEDIEAKYGGTHPNLTQFWPPLNTRNQPNDEFQVIATVNKESEYYSIDNNSKEFYNNSKMKVSYPRVVLGVGSAERVMLYLQYNRFSKGQQVVLQLRVREDEINSQTQSSSGLSAETQIERLAQNPNKKLQLQEEKCTEIERENRILLEKIQNIMNHERKRASSYKTNPSDVKQSLNKEKRKKELVRITIENQKMFNRLTAKKANYETRFILRQTFKQQQWVQQIGEYPRKNRIQSSKRQKSADISSKLESSFVNPAQPQQKIFLYKQNKSIQDSNYHIEIYYEDKQYQ